LPAPGPQLTELGLEDFGKASGRQATRDLSLEHRLLGPDHFAEIALHEEQAVRVGVGKRGDQRVDHLDGVSRGMAHPARVPTRGLDGLEFAIAARVVAIGLADPVAEGREPPGHEHLHEERCSRSRNARDHGDELRPHARKGIGHARLCSATLAG
jgi:hypothetical protein